MGGIHKLLKVEIAINKGMKNVGDWFHLSLVLRHVLSPDYHSLHSALVFLEIMHL